MILLNEQSILTHVPLPVNFHLFSSIDSTNRFLMNMDPRLREDDPYIDVCCAETQTQGRGRFGRHWHSPFGENIYCSSRWYFDCDASRLSGLGLVVSMAVMSTLSDFQVDEGIGIKWPNDLLWQGKKLCGSLIEIRTESHGRVALIIGIGLNVNSSTKDNTILTTPWCSLHEITGNYFNRNQLIASMIVQLNIYLNQFMTKGLASFADTWQKLDYLYGKKITVSQPLGQLTGLAQGINNSGQLLLMDEQGNSHELSSGETSLHLG